VTPEQRIDVALDSVLKASGSALRHYTMPKTLADMREAMRKALFDEYIRGLNESMSDWQPIETAPKDGTRLLLATPTGKVADGMWSTRYEVWSWPYVMAEPTHWMPAPPIPTIAHN
jgi:hypothetical protein